ncbi:NagC Transcriptional regulator/sugar kinase [Acidimicrobiia bacterium]
MSKLSIGIDVGGTKILAVAIDPSDSTILFESRADTSDSADALIAALADIVEVVSEGATAVSGNAKPVVRNVGLGLPGIVDSTGMLRAAPNLQCAIDVDVKSRLEAILGLPIVVENDASCAAWAEAMLGAGRGVRDLLLVTLGTGIGGGIVRSGELVRGAHGFAGEPGHMLVDPSGPTCTCGRSGCWERFASGTGLGWLGSRAALRGDAPGLLEQVGGDAERIDGELVSVAAQSGDQGALDVFGEFSWWLAAGLANLANLLDPELLLIGGGLADCADLYLEQTRVHFRELVLGGAARTETGIEVATLGSRAGAVGAALLAIGGKTEKS